jgi:TATA-box binding protein (TBP) (component of TFIID and TFIIIB)
MEPPQLSTMVVLYATNLKFDTTKLAECIPLSEKVIKVEKKGVIKKGESSRDKIKHRAKKDKKNTSNTGFGHNSITIVMMNDADGTLPKKEITVKIFQNGMFHLTGILDDNYDRDTMKNLVEILENDCRPSFKEEIEKTEILNRRVVLMNYTTKLTSNQTIPREALHNGIRNAKFENIVSYYDPDVYPGVKIHIGTNKWTANVFRTGKIILTGIRSHDDCMQLIEKLMYLFQELLPTRLQ